ncbi:MAG: amidophosphoribosyltransferase [Methanosarcinales archaeon]|nr:MAG: amidophosphoribosyltransferase [Methanosarcinales archaeon]
MQEECGVAGISFKENSNNAASSLYCALFALQHRGQESAGISIYDGTTTRTKKGMGLVPQAFRKNDLNDLSSTVGIGHVRYSTTGDSSIENAQPLVINYKDGILSLAHNGNLVNSQELRDGLVAEQRIFHSDSDTEVIAQLFIKELSKKDIISAIKEMVRMLIGSYAILMLIEDRVIAFRDPLGIKPLCIGKLEGGYVIASESCAIDVVGGTCIRDVKPGELIILRNGAMEARQLYNSKHSAHCIFEHIYFARADSILDSKLTYQSRIRVGETLYDEHPVNADIAFPVPDSGTTFAIGYAHRSGIQYLEGLIKNRYSGRTFIMPGQNMREAAVRLKLNTIKQNIKGKSVVIVDDSIVRGTTSRRIVDMVRAAGAREVHVRVGSPPIIAPCYLGIDMPTRNELIASDKTVRAIESLINADSLGYISLEGLIKSIGMPAEDFCTGCFTGVYPVEIPGEQCTRAQLKITEF